MRSRLPRSARRTQRQARASFRRTKRRGFQLAEMDRRPQQPRQLAGENGSSERCEASFDIAELPGAELPGERLFNADADSFRPGVALDDAMDADRAADDVAFKPNCLGIQASTHEHSADSRVQSQVQA